jgi:hypothetical protein
MNIIQELKNGAILTKESCLFFWKDKEKILIKGSFVSSAALGFLFILTRCPLLPQSWPTIMKFSAGAIGYFFFYYFLPRGQVITASKVIRRKQTSLSIFFKAGLSTPSEIIKLVLSYATLVLGLSILWLFFFSIVVIFFDSVTIAHLFMILKRPYLIIYILFSWSATFFQYIFSLPIFTRLALIIPTVTFQLVWFYFAFLISAYEKANFFKILLSSLTILMTNIVKYVSLILLLVATSFLLASIYKLIGCCLGLIMGLAGVTLLSGTIIAAVFTTKIYWNKKNNT